jgi:hypothetical protein
LNRKKLTAVKGNSSNEINHALVNAKASMEIEGNEFTPAKEQLLLDRANGQISHSEFLVKAKELARYV